MTIILFLVVLAVLIFVHELGHFIVAKKSGIRVDEFAIGFPPKIIDWVRGETRYVLNFIPFGGYVKIFGEDPDEISISGADSARSFVNAKKWKQAGVLLSGVFFNILFAWVLISVSFMFGSLVPIGDSGADYSKYAKNPEVIITQVVSNSPAQKIGLKAGDNLIKIISNGQQYGADDSKDISIAQIQQAISSSKNKPLEIFYKRSGKLLMATVTPVSTLAVSTSSSLTPVTYEVQTGDTLNSIAAQYGFSNYKMAGIISVPSGNFDLIRLGDIVTIGNAKSPKISATREVTNGVSGKKEIGIYMENVGVVKLNPVLAIWEGGKLTVLTFKQVAVGLAKFIWQALQGHGDFSQVSGPVGIVGLVGSAAHFGLAYFLGFVAFISLNLAVINLIPFPALDGGRVLFVVIEAIIGRPIKPKIANTLNTIGFFLLIALMIIITYRDIIKLFN